MFHRLNLLAISLSYSLSKATDSFLLLLGNCFSQTLDFFSTAFYDYSYHHRLRHQLYGYYDDDRTSSTTILDYANNDETSYTAILNDLYKERLYLVSFRWWKEAQECLFSDHKGILYTVPCCKYEGFFGLDREMVLHLEKVEKSDDGDHVKEMGYSGREYAIIEEWKFLNALKWHNIIRNTGSSLAREDNISKDLFSMKIRLSFSRRTDLPVLKINLKDNDLETLMKAHAMLYVKSALVQIWDFSDQTTQFFTNDRKPNSESNQQNEILMELKVYGLISHVKEMRAVQSKIEDTRYEDLLIQVPPPFSSSISETCNLGLSGLENLGNTCFMNSTIQCLVHTSKLNDYFLSNFRIDLNINAPLGNNGKLALAFGDLLRQLWAPGVIPVTLRMFKSVFSGYAPQFGGYKQHDSQEFLAFLLDGLHEDLNRVKSKPYIEVKDRDNYPDEQVANECWQNHLTHNDSIIVDLFQGQYRSTLVCPLCKKKSITFDPFMYLSLPLPSTTMRTMTLTLLSTDGTALPISVNITVPMNGSLKDVVQAVSTSCSLEEDETLLLAKVYRSRILHFLDKPSDSIEVIKDSDQIVVYRLLKVSDESALVVFMHQREELYYEELSVQRFGIPLVARMSDLSAGSEIHKRFPELLTPFLMPDKTSADVSNDGNNAVNPETGGISLVENDFEFYLEGRMSKILGNEPVPGSRSGPINVVVSWPVKMLQLYDTSRLSLLPEIGSVSIYKCVDAFLKEEPLGSNDKWYCPKCMEHQNASKKLDLWRLPEILVIHLKRFSSNHKDKLETFVDFPVDDFDLSGYAVQRGVQVSSHYKLYAVNNHYGGMASGHYTAFAQHGGDSWFEFNDSRIKAVDVERIKTCDAYVLFYRRISDV